jgi:hypothetical protein
VGLAHKMRAVEQQPSSGRIRFPREVPICADKRVLP